jgi:hypothetical protein
MRIRRKSSVEEHRAQASLGFGVEIEVKNKKTISLYRAEAVMTRFPGLSMIMMFMMARLNV